MYVGSPETVANRIAAVVRTLGLSRFDLLYAVGRVPHEQRMATIELYGREVIPRVRELLAAAPETECGSGAEPWRSRSENTPAAPLGATARICGWASSARASSARRLPAPRSRPATTSRSRDPGAPEDIALTVDVLAPGARAVTTDEVVRHADIIVLAVPTHRFRELPPDLFDGKILVDAMNYWEPVDGIDDELAAAADGTSTVVQERFPAARVVKSLNQLGYHELDEQPASAGGARPHRDRRGRRRPPGRPRS